MSLIFANAIATTVLFGQKCFASRFSFFLLLSYCFGLVFYLLDKAVGLVCPNNHVVSSLVHHLFDHLYFEIVRLYANLQFPSLFAFTLDHHYAFRFNSFRFVLHVVFLTEACYIFPLPSSTNCKFTSFHVLLSFLPTKIFLLILYHVPFNHLCDSAKYHAIWR